MTDTTIHARRRQLERMTLRELRGVQATLTGEPCASRHRGYLIKRILWWEQARDRGGLSERARERARTLARDADLRLTAPRVTDRAPSAEVVRGRIAVPDDGTLLPGTVLRREYKGRTLLVTVLPGGFEHEGVIYRSLSAVARAATGSHWNGRLFFGLSSPGAEASR